MEPVEEIDFSEVELNKTATILSLTNAIFRSYITSDYTKILAMLFSLFMKNKIVKRDRTNINICINNIDVVNKSLIDMFVNPELDKFSFLKMKTFENEIFLLEMYLTNIGMIDVLIDEFNSIHENIDKIYTLFLSSKITSYLIYR